MNMKFDLRGLRELQAQVQRQLQSTATQAVTAGCQAAVAVARTAAPSKTGELRGSIRTTEMSVLQNRTQAVVKADAKYAWYVERGTKAHIIRPKAPYNAKTVLPGQTRRARGKGPHEYIVGRGYALRWKTVAGKEIFRRLVHHSGTGPQPFIGPAKSSAYWAMMQIVRRVFG
jgi:hypothetical protein